MHFKNAAVLLILLTCSRPIVDGFKLTNEYFQTLEQGKALFLTFEANAFIEPTNDDSYYHLDKADICINKIIFFKFCFPNLSCE